MIQLAIQINMRPTKRNGSRCRMARPAKYVSRARASVIEDLRAKGESVPSNISYVKLADLVAKHYKVEWSGGRHVALVVITSAASPISKLRPRTASAGGING